MNKRGRFVWPRSLIWLGLALLFLYIAVMPYFNFFPVSFEIGENLLRFFILLAGLLIFIESFRRHIRFKKFIHIILGLFMAVFGFYIFLMGVNVPLPFEFNINKIILQIVLGLYAIYLLIGAFEQTQKNL